MLEGRAETFEVWERSPRRVAKEPDNGVELLIPSDKVDALGARGEQIVLQWGRPEIGVDDGTRLRFNFDNPFGKFSRVWNCCRQKDVLDIS